LDYSGFVRAISLSGKNINVVSNEGDLTLQNFREIFELIKRER
jgi:hypothetical protein